MHITCNITSNCDLDCLKWSTCKEKSVCIGCQHIKNLHCHCLHIENYKRWIQPELSRISPTLSLHGESETSLNRMPLLWGFSFTAMWIKGEYSALCPAWNLIFIVGQVLAEDTMSVYRLTMRMIPNILTLIRGRFMIRFYVVQRAISGLFQIVWNMNIKRWLHKIIICQSSW